MEVANVFCAEKCCHLHRIATGRGTPTGYVVSTIWGPRDPCLANRGAYPRPPFSLCVEEVDWRQQEWALRAMLLHFLTTSDSGGCAVSWHANSRGLCGSRPRVHSTGYEPGSWIRCLVVLPAQQLLDGQARSICPAASSLVAEADMGVTERHPQTHL